MTDKSGIEPTTSRARGVRGVSAVPIGLEIVRIYMDLTTKLLKEKYARFPLLPRALVGPILQARPPPESVPNYLTDWDYELEPQYLAPQHTAVPLTDLPRP